LAPSWLHFGPSWLILAPPWPILDPSWAILPPQSLPRLPQSLPRLPQPCPELTRAEKHNKVRMGQQQKLDFSGIEPIKYWGHMPPDKNDKSIFYSVRMQKIRKHTPNLHFLLLFVFAVCFDKAAYCDFAKKGGPSDTYSACCRAKLALSRRKSTQSTQVDEGRRRPRNRPPQPMFATLVMTQSDPTRACQQRILPDVR